MNNLWRKDGEHLFIDLLDSIETHYSNEVTKWDEYLHKLKSTKIHDSAKNEAKSTEMMQEGDMYFQNRQFYHAMESYTKSLRFAKIDSDKVAMAFASRATCFFHMQMYDRALIDVGLALQANCPERLITQMEKLQADCHQMLHTNSVKFPEKSPEFKMNEKFPCLADALTVTYNDEFGRHVVANRDIDVGQQVLMEEKFASVAKNDEMACYTCLTEMGNFIACSNCSDVIFCSQKCMDSNNVHRFDCNTLYHKLHFKVQFTIRTILIAIQSYPNIDSLMKNIEADLNNDDLPESMTDLQSYYRLYLKLKKIQLKDEVILDVYRLYTSAMIVSSIKQFFDSTQKQRFLMHLILHHLAINVTNASENEYTASIGTVISLFNHSCAPNLYNYSIDSRKFCVTIRPVKKGEQLFISYLGTGDDQSAIQRQILLKSKWEFECKCDKCEPRGRIADSNKMKLDPCFKFVHRNFKPNPTDHMNTTILKKKCTKFLMKYGHLPFSNELNFISDIYTKLI